VEADIGLGQLLYGKGNHKGDDPRIWMTASAFHIPFRDEAVDGVVCCRLSHHLPTPEERERLVSELLRVAKRFVIMTFFDHYSVKNLVRRARAPFDGQPPKMTMTIEGVRELSREHGAELVAYPPLSRLFSGHRYALMVKA
jgi:ubiquinone/menaquinone biosynthesis C-methylase UbiE